MKLWEYVNKTVRLALVDGTSVIGKVLDWYDGVDLDGDDEIVIEVLSKLKLSALSSDWVLFLCTKTEDNYEQMYQKET